MDVEYLSLGDPRSREINDLIGFAGMTTRKGRRYGLNRTKKTIEKTYKVAPRSHNLIKMEKPTSLISWDYKEDSAMNTVEYELDEMDKSWLGASSLVLTVSDFEFIMDFLEKYSVLEANTERDWSEYHIVKKEHVICCICHVGPEPDLENDIVTCNICRISVHQNCYGVPIMSDGIWTCKKCIVCPMKSVSCLLCPNFKGAYKLSTPERQWVHIKCAMCIPEVGFSNFAFMEPIDNIKTISAAKWKSKCYICKSSDGAAVKCSVKNCSKTFHATCPDRPGKRLPISEQRNGTNVCIKPYCAEHLDALIGVSQLQRTSVLEIHKRSIATSFYPSVSEENLATLQALCDAARDTRVLTKVKNYWILKRKDQDGAPLIPRLQNCLKSGENKAEKKIHNDELSKDDIVRHWNLLEFYKTNLTKKGIAGYENVRLRNDDTNCTFRPMDVSRFFSKLITKMVKEDKKQCFCGLTKQKKTRNSVPPMDLKRIREKCASYWSVQDLQNDFNMMINSSLSTSKRQTSVYREAKRLQKWSVAFFENAKNEFNKMSSSEGIKKYGNVQHDSSHNNADLHSLVPQPSWKYQQRWQTLLNENDTALQHRSK